MTGSLTPGSGRGPPAHGGFGSPDRPTPPRRTDSAPSGSDVTRPRSVPVHATIAAVGMIIRPELRRLATRVLGRMALRRWGFLILGGALITPYVMAVSVVGVVFGDYTASFLNLPDLVPDAVLALPLVTLSGLLPAVPGLEVAAVRTLLRRDLLPAGKRSRPDQWRVAGWYTLHLGVGGLVSAFTLAAPSAAAILMVLPFGELRSPLGTTRGGWEYAWGPPAGLGMLGGMMALAAVSGELLARWAPALLGPSVAERLAALERRRAEAEAGNDLARELHDSLGHTLSVVALQASAARTMLERDPAFARNALSAIEETSRAAVADLDGALETLRTRLPTARPLDDAGTSAPWPQPPAQSRPPTLSDLDALLSRTRAAGAPVTARIVGDLDRVPLALSSQAYRIVQEGLTNALRHAGVVPVTLRIAVGDDRLELDLANPLPAPGARPTSDGARPTSDGPQYGTARDRRAGRPGQGLHGLTARVSALSGTVTAGAIDGQWRITVRLPLGEPS